METIHNIVHYDNLNYHLSSINCEFGRDLLDLDAGNYIALRAMTYGAIAEYCDTYGFSGIFEYMKDSSVNLLIKEFLIRISQKTKYKWDRSICLIWVLRRDSSNDFANQYFYNELNSDDRVNCISSATFLLNLNPQNYRAISKLMEVCSSSEDNKITINALRYLSKALISDKSIFNAYIKLVLQQMNLVHNDESAYNHILEGLKLNSNSNRNALIIVSRLKGYLTDDVLASNYDLYFACYDVILHCAQNLSYPQFYEALHNSENCNLASLINNLSLNIQATKFVYPLLLDFYSLSEEKDKNTISQEIINQIYIKYHTQLRDYLEKSIPENINNWSKLKTKIANLKRKLSQEHLAIVIEQCNPNKEIIDILDKLTDTVSICMIADTKLEIKNLTVISPQSSNLQSAVEAWLDKITQIE